MNGARAAALNFLLSHMEYGTRVLDIGAGDSPLARMLTKRQCKVIAIDTDAERLSKAWEAADQSYEIAVMNARDMEYREQFDIAIAVYSVQHMIPYEPLVWVKVREALRLGGRFMIVGRYQVDAPRYEERADPLIGANEQTIGTLATLSGFELKHFWHYQYQEDDQQRCSPVTANAFGAVLEAI